MNCHLVGWEWNTSLSGGVKTGMATFLAPRALSIVHCLATKPVLALVIDAKRVQSQKYLETEVRAEQAGRVGEDKRVTLGRGTLELGSELAREGKD